MQTIIRHLKKFGQAKRGISNVIVVMLSLILIVLIVGNVVLWSYQMNQFDMERMQEIMQVKNVTRITRSPWFTAQGEFSILAGNRISGTYSNTQLLDGFPETFREDFPSISYYPSSYTLGGLSTFVNGSTADLHSNDSVYMSFHSYPSAFSDATETFGNTTAGTSSRNTENTIVGSVFTPTKDGEAQSINACIRITSQAKNMRCAIYLHSNLSLVAQTEEKNVPTGTAWVTFNFPSPKPMLRANTEYLLVAWSSSGNGWAYLYYTSGTTNQGHYVTMPYGTNFSDPMPTPNHDNRAYSIYCTFKPATEETFEVEFLGNSNPEPWTDLTWTIDCCFTSDTTTATFQLYNYQTGEYPTSGDGYMEATIGTADVTMTQTITSNPEHFRDPTGNWKLKIRGVKNAETPFDFKADLMEFKATLSNIYRLDINNYYKIDLSAYSLNCIQGIEILVRYNVTENLEKWFLKAYNWTAASFSNWGFNSTDGNQPTPMEWNEYAISIIGDWRSYVKDDGAMLIEFFDEGLNTNQKMVDIDFLGVRVIIDGAQFNLKNMGSVTAHIVSIWIINSTSHQRYNANLFINIGEEAIYIRADISLPEEFIAKVVTERGNIAVFTQS